MKDKKIRLVPLDSLRGIAACIVAFIWHYQHFINGFQLSSFKRFEQPLFRNLSFLYTEGYIAVELFFIISGFVFSHVYMERIRVNGLSDLKQYSVNRFARLYPLHIITLLFILILILFSGREFVYTNNNIKYFILNVLFLQCGWITTETSFNGPSWSVSCEIFMYFIFFFVISILYKFRCFVFSLFILLGFTILYVAGKYNLNLNYPIINLMMLRVIIFFSVGVLTYEINKKFVVYNTIIRNWLPFFVYILSIIFSIIYNSIFYKYHMLLITYYFFPLVIILVINNKYIETILSIKPLKILGDLSYSIYMIHFPIQYSIILIFEYFKWKINYISVYFLISYSIITIFIAYFIHYFIEKPLDKKIKMYLNEKKP